jgi:hypothetical protein
MKLQVLAGALALGLGASALAPVAARADDRSRSYRSYRSDSYRSDRSYRSGRSYHSNRAYRSGSYRSYRPYRYNSYYRSGYRGYAYYDPYYYSDYAYGGYYGDYYDYGYRPRAVVVPSYRYRGYRPLLGVRVGGPHFGVWLGF